MAALEAYGRDRDRAWALLEARGSAVGPGPVRSDVAGHEARVETAIRRFRGGVTTLADVVGAVSAARACFAAVTLTLEGAS